MQADFADLEIQLDGGGGDNDEQFVSSSEILGTTFEGMYVEPTAAASELRQRNIAAAPLPQTEILNVPSYSIPPMAIGVPSGYRNTPSPPPNIQMKNSKFENLLSSIELWRNNTGSDRMERLWKKRRVFVRCICGLISVICLYFAVIACLSDPNAYVHSVGGSAYVRHGEDGVNFSVPSRPFSCVELREAMLRGPRQLREEHSISKLRTTAETLLESNLVACVCAPMYGTFRRMLSLRTSNVSVLHMYNCERDVTWQVNTHNRSRVIENQDVLFPRNRGDYAMIRFDEIRVTYRDQSCKTKAHIFRKTFAWCTQACFDLFDGRAVHQLGKRVKL